MDFEEAVSEGLWENEGNHVGIWKRESLCYIVAKILAILLPAIVRKVENVPNELGVESAFYFFLLLAVKFQEKRQEAKAVVVNKTRA